jgi:AcrR family transcriptional regulator
MATPPKNEDRRVKRTRQLLQQASIEVMREKGFTAMSVQDITERANVNRGTFYAHFTDKYALLDVIIRDYFQQVLASKLPPVTKWEPKTLHLLIQVVLEYFQEMQNKRHSTDLVDQLIEQATREELAGLLLTWLKQQQKGKSNGLVPLETVAHVMSGAIFGAAIQWSRDSTALSSEQMASDVLRIMMEGVARLTSDTSLI